MQFDRIFYVCYVLNYYLDDLEFSFRLMTNVTSLPNLLKFVLESLQNIIVIQTNLPY